MLQTKLIKLILVLFFIFLFCQAR